MSGSCDERLAAATASARSLPLRTCGSTAAGVSIIQSICPPMRSIVAGLLPLYGMCVAPRPSLRLSESADRCPSVPDPAEPKFCLRASAFAFATSSGTFPTLSAGLTTSTSGVPVTSASGAKSRRAS
jgi:hypothetical protein